MTIVTLYLPEVKSFEESRPSRCPYCPGGTFQRWGGALREVRDPHIKQVVVYRYCCCRCRRTFRHYSPGVGRASQTQRMRILAAMCWLLGLSYWGLVLGSE
jgi:C4-type Zn-finger protein